MPNWLLEAREAVSAFAGIRSDALVQALAGASIGWHKDRSVFGDVGLSLSASAAAAVHGGIARPITFCPDRPKFYVAHHAMSGSTALIRYAALRKLSPQVSMLLYPSTLKIKQSRVASALVAPASLPLIQRDRQTPPTQLEVPYSLGERVAAINCAGCVLFALVDPTITCSLKF